MSNDTGQPMSPYIASVILCMAVALEDEDRGLVQASLVFTDWPDWPGDVNEDDAIREAADVIGRDRIKDRTLLRLLADIDARTEEH